MLQQPPDVAASAVELIRAIVEIGEKVVVALVGIVGATVSLWRLARARIAARSLRTHVGATQYTRADIETALSNFISPRCTVVDLEERGVAAGRVGREREARLEQHVCEVVGGGRQERAL